MEGESVQVCIRVTEGSFASNAVLTFELDPVLGNGKIRVCMRVNLSKAATHFLQKRNQIGHLDRS